MLRTVIRRSRLIKLAQGLAQAAQPRQGTKEIHYDTELPLVPLDKDRIEQVLFNIISNAIAAMADQETRVLRAATRMTNKKDYARIIISDTGAGIDGSDMGKIFDPFFTTKDSVQGTGLGLSISYSIIQDHGGRIWAENNEWGGASFFIELPLEAINKE